MGPGVQVNEGRYSCFHTSLTKSVAQAGWRRLLKKLMWLCNLLWRLHPTATYSINLQFFLSLNKSWDVKAASLHFSWDRNKTACVPRKTSAETEAVCLVLFIHCSLWAPVWMQSRFCQENWLLVSKLWPRFQRHSAPRTANRSIRNGLWSLSPKQNKSTAVNSSLHGLLLFLCFFENVNNDNHWSNCLPRARCILSICLNYFI